MSVMWVLKTGSLGWEYKGPERVKLCERIEVGKDVDLIPDTQSLHMKFVA
jgi:hypothetical protein